MALNEYDPQAEQAEEYRGLIPRALSGLQWIGESIDKPAAVVRSLFQGDPGAALHHAIPFSDTFSGPADRHYWGDYLAQGQPGGGTFWNSTLPGLGLDIATDPLTWLGAGLLPGLGKNTLTGAGRAAGLARKVGTTTEEWVRQLSRVPEGTEPLRKMFGGGVVPFQDLIEHYTGANLPRWTVDPFGRAVTEKVANAMAYNPLTAAGRRLFSTIPGIGVGAHVSELNELARKEYGETLAQTQKRTGEAWLTAKHGLDEAAHAESAMQIGNRIAERAQQEIIVNGQKQGNMIDTLAIDSVFRSMLEEFSPRGMAENMIVASDPKLFQDPYQRLLSMKSLLKNPESLTEAQRSAALSEMQALQSQFKTNFANIGVHDDVIKNALGIQDFAPGAAAQSPNDISQVVRDFVVNAETAITQKNKAFEILGKMGLGADDLKDITGHWPRQIGRLAGEQGKSALGKKEFPYSIEREDFLKNISGVMRDSAGNPTAELKSTALIRGLARDPILTSAGTDLGKEFAAAAKKAGEVVPLAPGDDLTRKVVMMSDGVPALVTGQDPMGNWLATRATDAANLPIDLTKVKGVFDAAAKPQAYQELLEMAHLHNLRGGKWTSEAAVERLQNHWGVKFAPTVEELAGAKTPEEVAARTAEVNLKKSKELLGFLGQQPKETLRDGLFNLTWLRDHELYMQAAAKSVAAFEFTKSMLARGASMQAKEGWIPLTEALEGLLGPKADHAWAINGVIERMRETANGLNRGAGSVVKPNAIIGSVLQKAMENAKSGDPLEVARHLYVPPDAAKLAAGFMDLHVQSEKHSNDLMGIIKGLNDAFKATTYGIFPASQMRNRISGFINNILHGASKLKNELDASKFFTSGGKLAPEMREAAEEALAYGAFGGSKAADAYGELTHIKAPGEGSLDTMLRPVTAFAGTAPWKRENLPEDVFGLANPAQELLASIGFGKSEGGRWNRLPSREMQQRSALVAGGQNLSSITENSNRLAAYKTLRDKGWSPVEAAAKVRQIHFDYSDLSNIDRNLQAYIPFYTWTRKNLPHQFLEAMTNPGGPTGQAVRTSAALQRGAADSGAVPTQLQEATSFVVPGLGGSGAKVAASLKGLFPWEDLHWFSTTGEGLGNIPGVNPRTAEKMVGMLNPALLAIYQEATGREAFSGQSLKDKQVFPAGTAEAETLFNVFLGRPISVLADTFKIGKQAVAGQGQELANDLSRFATKMIVGGVRQQKFYPEEERLKQQREAIEAYLKRQPGVGMFERPFLREGEAAPIELKRASKLLSGVQEALRRERDRRESLGLPGIH